MKVNKYLSLAAVALMGAGLVTSCDNSKDNDFVQEYTGAPGVYFSNTANAYLELSDDSNTIVYPVYRDDAGAELTVGVTVTPVYEYESNDMYSFPSSVTFPAGSKVADFVITYDISKTELGVEQEYELVLDAEPNPFSSNNVVITLVNPAPWELIGTDGVYYDYGWGVDPDYNESVQVSVWQQQLDRNLFRVSNPYIGWNGDANSYFEFRLLQPGDNFLGVDITMEDLVGFTLYYIQYDSDEQDDIYLAFPGIFNVMGEESYWTGSRVVEYQDNGLPGLIQIAPLYYLYNSGGVYNYPDLTPYVYINFPGYVSLDTSLSVTYEGILTPDSQEQVVLLNVEELGSDITEARAAVGPGKSADAILSGMENGSIDYVDVESTGLLYVDFGNDNETGDYTWVVAAYVNDEVKAVVSGTFFYISSSSDYDPNEGWTSKGYVQYTDGYVCANEFLSEPIVTYWVELQEYDATPGLYRLVNPYGEPFPYNEPGDYNANRDCYLNIDASDPTKVVVLESPQTLDWTGDALDYCWSMAQFFRENGSGGQPVTDDQIAAAGFFGTLEDGLITFPFQALCAYWSYADYPDYSGLVYANMALDWDKYQAGNNEDPYLEDEDGEFVAPFCVNLNSLAQEIPAESSAARMTIAAHKFNRLSSIKKGQPIDRKAIKIEKNKGPKKGQFQKLERRRK